MGKGSGQKGNGAGGGGPAAPDGVRLDCHVRFAGHGAGEIVAGREVNAAALFKDSVNGLVDDLGVIRLAVPDSAEA